MKSHVISSEGITSNATSSESTQSCCVPPPPSVTPFVALNGTGPHEWIGYDSHPAYAGRATGFAGRLRSTAVFLRYFSIILSKRAISYELIPAHVRKRGGIPFARVAFANMRRKLFGGSVVDSAKEECPIAGALSRDGICVLRLEPNMFAPIAAKASPILNDLRRMRGERTTGGRDFAESRASALRTTSEGLFHAVESMLRDSGALAGISAYIGREARLVDVNPQINNPSDDFWARTFPDMPALERPCSYVHKDASGGDIKAMIYLSDVGERSGPFIFAVGSHPPRRTRLADWVEETNDQSGFSGTNPDVRARFMSLPRLMRRKCAFGNDVRPGSEFAARILRSEWGILASRGHLVIFDTKGFHRGGMVTEGERAVITCVIG